VGRPLRPAVRPPLQDWQAGTITERDYWRQRAAAHGLETQAFMGRSTSRAATTWSAGRCGTSSARTMPAAAGWPS
jgi:hypothetical protein